MSSSNGVLQDPAADATVLVTWLNLNFTDLYGVRVLEQLDHANARTIYFNNRNATTSPALVELSGMSNFVPATKSCFEQVLVHVPAQTFEPCFILGQCWNQLISHLAPSQRAH